MAVETPWFASKVEAPRCGVKRMFLALINGESITGSFSNTSRAAPEIVPSLSAMRSAFSSMIPPLAQLIICAVGFIIFKRSRSNRPTVESVFGT